MDKVTRRRPMALVDARFRAPACQDPLDDAAGVVDLAISVKGKACPPMH